MNIPTLPSSQPMPSALDALPPPLRRRLLTFANETHRPTWATDEMIKEVEAQLQRSLMAAGWTGAMTILADAAKLINLPEDEVILREYVERLQEYPADVLERAVRRVAETYEYKTPPRVGPFMRHIHADTGYQRTRAAVNTLTLIKQTAPLPSKSVESAEDRAKVLAGFKELLGSQSCQKAIGGDINAEQSD